MYKVQSKFKNPDKLIERLKDTIRYKQDTINYRDKRIETLLETNKRLTEDVLGSHWFTYSKDVTKGVTFTGLELAQLAKLGDIVFIKGNISKLLLSNKAGENEATFTLTEVYLKK